MNLDKIRNMSDNELRSFMNELSQRNNIFCSKCGNVVSSRSRKTINVGINENGVQKTRKLCSLCTMCYVDLLDFLGMEDIDWSD